MSTSIYWYMPAFTAVIRIYVRIKQDTEIFRVEVRSDKASIRYSSRFHCVVRRRAFGRMPLLGIFSNGDPQRRHDTFCLSLRFTGAGRRKTEERPQRSGYFTGSGAAGQTSADIKIGKRAEG